MGLLTKFFLLTYAVTWACFISVAVLSQEVPSTSPGLDALQGTLLFLGTITPSLAALWLTFQGGMAGETKKLFSRIGKWKVNFGWYVFATVISQ